MRTPTPVVVDGARGGRAVLSPEARRGGGGPAHYRWNPDWRNDHRYDWRQWRERHRSTFHVGFYYDPFGYNYRQFEVGYRLTLKNVDPQSLHQIVLNLAINAAQASSKVLASPWKFTKHGRCGTEVSELLPHTAEIVDDLAVVRSMHTGVNNHGQSIYALANGRITVDAEEKSLVDFLYKLGDDTSMIRVREFDLKPADANRYR